MSKLWMKWFGGMVPRRGEQHLTDKRLEETGYFRGALQNPDFEINSGINATEAENCNLYSGELRPLHKPALAHQFCRPGDACWHVPIPDDPSIPPPEPPPEPPFCAPVVITGQPGPPVCLHYICDALEQAILSTGPLIYYIWNGIDTGTTPSTWVNQGSASVNGQHLGTTGRYTDDPANPYIDNCAAGLFPFKINSNAGAHAKEVANDQLWIGGQAAGENCTFGCLLNVFDNKVSWASGLTNRILFTSQAYTETGSNPYEYASYSVWLYPNTGRVRLKMMVFQPFGSVLFFYPDVFIDPDLLFDVNGGAKNVTFACHVQRHVATQTVDIKVWVDGTVAASGYGIYNTQADSGDVFENNDGSRAGLDGSGLEIGGDGPSSDNGGGTVIFSHQWVALGESSQAHIDTIAAALPRNYLSYIDPNPDCRDPL